jgi:16S rRNA (cytosine1402-N4)-methyltransferase
MEKKTDYHIPVLYEETLDNLVWNPDGIYVDCTLGGGGHSEGILERLSDKGRLIAIDQDQVAIDYASKRLEKYNGKFNIFKDNFSNIQTVVYLAGYDKVDGILMDIGVSSKQLDDGERGFSYKHNARLDMRMDRNSPLSAYEVINEYSEEELARIIYEYGEDRNSRRIARAIVKKREEKPIETTDDLVGAILSSVKGKSKKHPAKQTFQAIRIEVNKELDVLKNTIENAVDLLNTKGRLAIITFHSLEDRIVKNEFKLLAKDCICPPEIPICMCEKEAKIKVLTRKPIEPGKEELEKNNRSHSSKLRVCERL